MQRENASDSERTGRIYLIRNIVNGKGYVGQTTLTAMQRFGLHKSKYRSPRHDRNSALHQAMRKYGESNFSIIVIEECPVSQLNSRETHYIREMKTFAPTGHGYNLNEGGGALRHSESTRDKLRKARLGRTVSEETRQKMAAAQRGKKASPETIEKMRRAQKGHEVSEEQRRNISRTLSGRKLSEEHKAKMSAALKGLKRSAHSVETRAKIAASRMGKPSWNKGKMMSQETKAKISAAGIGKTPWNKGKQMSQESRNKMSASRIRMLALRGDAGKVAA